MSRDGKKVYRMPAIKADSPYTNTQVQANFIRKEADETGKMVEVSNAHIDIEVVK